MAPKNVGPPATTANELVTKAQLDAAVSGAAQGDTWQGGNAATSYPSNTPRITAGGAA